MSDQPEALFLADVIENDPQSKAHHDAAAACLRRQHTEIASLKAECDAMDQLRRAAVARAGGIQRLLDLSDAACKKAEAERDALRSDLATLRAQNYNTQSLLAGAEAERDALRAALQSLLAWAADVHAPGATRINYSGMDAARAALKEANHE